MTTLDRLAGSPPPRHDLDTLIADKVWGSALAIDYAPRPAPVKARKPFVPKSPAVIRSR